MGQLHRIKHLISTKQNEFLKKLGWDYDTSNDKYYFNELEEVYEPIIIKSIKGSDIKVKYYLTEKQLKDIMKVRNPSNFVNDGGTLM